MAYITIENFIGGVDRSRPRYAIPPGFLWSGINGHITRGGDFEKRKAFVPKYTVPADTFGLQKVTAGLVVFGSVAPPAMPSGVTYQRLQHPTPATAMTRLLSSDLFNGKIYAIAQYADSSVHHFYDGTIIADWETQSGNTPTGGFGRIVRTHKRKAYSPVGSVLWFAAVDNPILWDTVADPGAGFQNLSTHQGGSDDITGMITYQNYLAAFNRRIVQVWDMQDDEDLNAPVQTIYESGTRAHRSVVGFGDIDAFYLSDSGIRSLRARSLTNLAGVNDVGTPIDDLVLEWMDGLTDTQISDAIGAVEPRDGRLWMCVGSRIFVFSYFPSKKVSAWTWYEPGVEFTDIVSFNGRLYARASDVIYLYGGDDNQQYDSTVARAEFPFLSINKAGHEKQFEGIDIAAQGAWDVSVRLDPRDENQVTYVGSLEGHTFQGDLAAAMGAATHAAPVFVSTGSGYASISAATIYHETGRPKN